MSIQDKLRGCGLKRNDSIPDKTISPYIRYLKGDMSGLSPMQLKVFNGSRGGGVGTFSAIFGSSDGLGSSGVPPRVSDFITPSVEVESDVEDFGFDHYVLNDEEILEQRAEYFSDEDIDKFETDEDKDKALQKRYERYHKIDEENSIKRGENAERERNRNDYAYTKEADYTRKLIEKYGEYDKIPEKERHYIREIVYSKMKSNNIPNDYIYQNRNVMINFVNGSFNDYTEADVNKVYDLSKKFPKLFSKINFNVEDSHLRKNFISKSKTYFNLSPELRSELVKVSNSLNPEEYIKEMKMEDYNKLKSLLPDSYKEYKPKPSSTFEDITPKKRSRKKTAPETAETAERPKTPERPETPETHVDSSTSPLVKKESEVETLERVITFGSDAKTSTPTPPSTSDAKTLTPTPPSTSDAKTPTPTPPSTSDAKTPTPPSTSDAKTPTPTPPSTSEPVPITEYVSVQTIDSVKPSKDPLSHIKFTDGTNPLDQRQLDLLLGKNNLVLKLKGVQEAFKTTLKPNQGLLEEASVEGPYNTCLSNEQINMIPHIFQSAKTPHDTKAILSRIGNSEKRTNEAIERIRNAYFNMPNAAEEFLIRTKDNSKNSDSVRKYRDVVASEMNKPFLSNENDLHALTKLIETKPDNSSYKVLLEPSKEYPEGAIMKAHDFVSLPREIQTSFKNVIFQACQSEQESTLLLNSMNIICINSIFELSDENLKRDLLDLPNFVNIMKPKIILEKKMADNYGIGKVSRNIENAVASYSDKGRFINGVIDDKKYTLVKKFRISNAPSSFGIYKVSTNSKQLLVTEPDPAKKGFDVDWTKFKMVLVNLPSNISDFISTPSDDTDTRKAFDLMKTAFGKK